MDYISELDMKLPLPNVNLKFLKHLILIGNFLSSSLAFFVYDYVLVNLSHFTLTAPLTYTVMWQSLYPTVIYV